MSKRSTPGELIHMSPRRYQPLFCSFSSSAMDETSIPFMASPKPFEISASKGRVLVIRNRSDDRFGPGSRIIRLEDA